MLSEAALAEHHRKTFYYSLNLTLTVARTDLRAADLEELIGALSVRSPLRDLREDLVKGLINIPSAVLDQARRQGATAIDYDVLVATPAVRAWIRSEFEREILLQEELSKKLTKLDDCRGRAIAQMLLRALQHATKKYQRKYSGLLASTCEFS